MQPKNVYWCDGTKEEYQFMCDMLVQAGSFVKLNPKKRPNRCVLPSKYILTTSIGVVHHHWV